MNAQRKGQLGIGVIVLMTLGVAMFRAAPARPAQPGAQLRRALFDEVVREEPTARERARDDWAHHRWSQQDAFGAFEHERIIRLAGEKGLFAQDLFLLVDEGLRAGWPGPEGKALDVATVPLRPRAMD